MQEFLIGFGSGCFATMLLFTFINIRLDKMIASLDAQIKELTSRKRSDEEPRSSIVEPKQETPAEQANREQKELLERLNRND